MKTSQSPFVSLVIVGVLVLMCMTLTGLAPIVLLWRMNTPKEKSSSSVPHLTAAESNRLARDAFNSFDLAGGPLLGSPPVVPTEFDQYLQQLEEESASEDTIDFLIPVNRDMTRKRILSILDSRSLSVEEEIFLQSQIFKSGPREFLNSLKFVRIHIPDEDPETRIVHAIGYSEDICESREWRFWFSRHDGSWKIFDWQRIDLGMSYSEQQSRHCARLFDGVFSIEADLESLEKILGTGDYDFVRETLGLIQTKPKYALSLQDFDWVRIAYVYLAIGDYNKTLECGRRVVDTEEFPGAHRVQQIALFQLKDYDASIVQGEAYMDLVGNSPEVLLRLGLALHATGNTADGDKVLGEFVQFISWEPNKLIELIASVREVSLPVIGVLLEHEDAPLQFATQLPSYYSSRRDGGMVLEALVSFAEATAPGEAETHYLKGELAAWNDDHETAYSQFQLAMKASVETEQKNKYTSSASRALLSLGRVEEAYELESSKSDLIESEYWARMNGKSILTEPEWTQLLLQHVKHDPNDALAVDKLLEHLIANSDLERAEEEIRQRFEFWKPTQKLDGPEDASNNPEDDLAGDADTQEPEYPYESTLTDSLGTRFAQVMVLSGRFETAYTEAVPRAEGHVEWLDDFFSELADELIELKKWESLTALLDLHSRNRPNDPNILMYRGHLAAHHQQWPQAIASYEQAIRMATDEGWTKHLSKISLHRTLCQSGMWLDDYRAASDKSSLFYELEQHMPDDEPEQLERLIAEHLNAVPIDKDFAIWMADREWGKLNEAGFVYWLSKTTSLGGGSESISYRMKSFQKRLARIDVRRGNDVLARQHVSDDADETALIEALIAARQQKHGDAAAKLQASRLKSMYELTKSENLGWDAFRPEYRELQRGDPFRLSSLDSMVQWVGYLHEPIALDLPKLTTSIQEVLGNEFTVTRKTHDPESAAFAPTFLLESQTPPHAKWYVQVQAKSAIDPLERTEFNPEQVAADNSKARIVVGRELREVSEWFWSPVPDPNNEVSKMLQLLEALAEENVAAWYDASQRKLVLPSAEWKFLTSPNASTIFRQHGVYGSRDAAHETIVRSRQREFRSGLRTALLAGDLSKLRVRKTQRIGFLREPVWFTVQSVQKVPNDLELNVSIANDMILVPAITAGFPCETNLSELDAWQIEGQDVVELSTEK
ncbi:MAG: hypothetical protein Q8M16_16950 [Pirellulaceae bacterium]|nr:hypothetical protein [Pirellulaceae bacterium]